MSQKEKLYLEVKKQLILKTFEISDEDGCDPVEVIRLDDVLKIIKKTYCQPENNQDDWVI